MVLKENISLKELTTFKAGGVVRYVADCFSVEDIQEAILFAQKENIPWKVLGEGSNMIPSEKGFYGIVLRLRCTEIQTEDISIHTTRVVADAGGSFDLLVHFCTEKELWGIENLAGIPGTVGAAPVQNIGAYGAEISDCLEQVEVFNVETGAIEYIEKEKCVFSYRESIFKKSHHFIILRVALLLSREGTPNISYPDLQKAQEEGCILGTSKEIAVAVRAIRSNKFPDWSVEGTAGSFFKNPIISKDVYDQLCARYGELPQYPAAGGVKIPLAFVLDKILGLRGYEKNGARLFEKQPLVLVLEKNGNADSIEALAVEVEKKVFDATSISIEREPQTFNF